jgi:acetyltransferase-like isoleucine patch superfamily enzyme
MTTGRGTSVLPPGGGGRFLLWLTNHVVSRVFFHRPRMWWYRTVMGYEIGAGSSILVDVRFSARGKLRIGAHSVVNNGCRIDNRGGVWVGDSVSLSYGATVYTKGHAIDARDFHTVSSPVTIHDKVWVCAGATVLPGVTLHEGAVVLTGSVVTKGVAEFEVVGGNPARHVRERSRDLDYEIDFHPWVPFFG